MPTAHQAIQPINVTGAAFLIQLILLGMLTATVFIMWLGEKKLPVSRAGTSNVLGLGFLILYFTLFTFAVLLISEEVISIFGKLFGLQIGGIKARNALSMVFALDIVLFAILIPQT
ncbi:MAG: hypothetical protein M0017_12105, partial [Desulfobacteraceae bacterium]|nr:hypothetical protein [Desulfobacteraceae bacterium]